MGNIFIAGLIKEMSLLQFKTKIGFDTRKKKEKVKKIMIIKNI